MQRTQTRLDICQNVAAVPPESDYATARYEKEFVPAQRDCLEIKGKSIQRLRGELWTSGQRQGSSLHEISYRACFKPQLPQSFIQRFSQPGDLIYDPFMGRGTTLIEAALLGREVIGNDVNRLSIILTSPRLQIPTLSEIQARLNEINMDHSLSANRDLSMFYHKDTEAEIVTLQRYLKKKREASEEDAVDRWIQMVATNRLAGHSAGFFSVYTLPPNQATSPERQQAINKTRKQEPPYRDVRQLILKKSKSLMRNLTEVQRERLKSVGTRARFYSQDARLTESISSECVTLTVTSPPFLDVVHYSNDNWLRCWFNEIDAEDISPKITRLKSLTEWTSVMQDVFSELFRITRRGGYVAFEVGEVRKKSIQLDEHVVPLGLNAGFECECLLVNEQKFTKTSNIWGISNNKEGTNTNRIVLFRK